MVGKTVSHYKILEKLGEGGMGVVYKALDTELDRIVALKFLPQSLAPDEAEHARFLQEAKAASALNHPNICAIHALGEHEGQRFIDMEFIDGETLRMRIADGGLRTGEAIEYAIQIAEALQEAHSRGIIHRDIKADNIMVSAKNQIKVMDFGLAKLKGSLKLTRTTSTVGTLSYMAPEQIEHETVDARSDLFSMGVVLYEMLTGHLPFRGEHEAAMMYSILNEAPEPIQKYVPDISSELVHIVDRALDKDPEDRYQSAHDMVIDLRRLKKQTTRVVRRPESGAGTGPIGPTPEAKPKRTIPFRRTGIAAACVLAVVVGALLLLSRGTPKLNRSPIVRTLEIPFSQIDYPGISADGNWIAFAARDASNEWSIYFMNVAKGEPRRLTTEPFQAVGYAEISPDGSEVLYDRTPPGMPNGIYIVSSLGGTGRRIAEPGTGARWRPDGKLIGYVQSGGPFIVTKTGKREFWTVRPDGSESRLIFVDSTSYRAGNFCFDWSPDGKSVAWLRSYPGYEELFIRDLASGKERQLTSYTMPITEIAWASNDQIFMTTSKGGNTNVWVIPAAGGEAVQVTKGSGPDIGVRVSADAKRLLFMEQRRISNLWTAAVDGSNARQLTFDNQILEMPMFSPDNSRISFTMSSADVLRPGSHLFVILSDGGNRVQLTAGEALQYYTCWSPDGKYLTYGSRRTDEPFDSSRVYLVEASNPGVPRLIGAGFIGQWIDADRIVTLEFLPHPRATLHFLHDPEATVSLQDSAWSFPLHESEYTLMADFRTGRRGWWLLSAHQGKTASAMEILPSELLTSAWPSINLRYLLLRQSNGEFWRISLPELKRERLPGILDRTDPWGGYIQLSYDGTRWTYLRSRIDARLVLMENVFE